MAKSNKRSKKSRARKARRPQPSGARAAKVAVAAARNPIAIGSRAEFEEYLKGEQPVLVDFWAPWCGPCKMMAPIFESVGEEFEGRVRFLKVDTQKLPELGAAFGVRSIPTLLALEGSEVTDSHVGLLPGPGLARMAQRADDRARGVGLRERLARMFGRGPGSDKATAGASATS